MLCGMTFFDFFSVAALWFAEKAEIKNKKAQFSFYRFSLNFQHCTAPGGLRSCRTCGIVSFFHLFCVWNLMLDGSVLYFHVIL